MIDSLAELGPWAWIALAVAAVFVGLSKTVAPGVATISVALFAMVLPARASTAALLLLLIAGDIYALIAYRRRADWRAVLRLLPPIAIGMVLGAVFLALADDALTKRIIAIVLLVTVTFNLWRRFSARHRRGASQTDSSDTASAADSAPANTANSAPAGPSASANPHAAGGAASPAPLLARATYGSLAGFTTMVANAAGPVMSLYFLAARYEMRAFLGTAAWLFAVVNLSKVPVVTALGLITPTSLLLDALLLPALLIGAVTGQLLARRISQRVFEGIVLFGITIGSIALLL